MLRSLCSVEIHIYYYIVNEAIMLVQFALDRAQGPARNLALTGKPAQALINLSIITNYK